VAPAPGTDIASIGTTRIDAYQEYLEGTRALKSFDLVPARTHLQNALKLDSTFALARYRLAILIGWDTPNDSMKRVHAAAAARLSGSLPQRERTLMKGLNAFEQTNYGVACETYGALVKADSSDVEALYGVGECSFHDNILVPLASDSSKHVFRGSWTTANRAFERVLQLDPGYHLAFQHIVDALSQDVRTGVDRFRCPAPRPLTQECRARAWVRRDGDTLLTVPVPVPDTAAYAAHAAEYVKLEMHHKNLEQARVKARAWVEAAPEETRAHVAIGHLHVLLGSAEAAQEQFAQVKGRLTDSEAQKVFPDRIEVAIKLGQPGEARRLLHSVRAVAPKGSTGPLMLSAAFGRMTMIDSVLRQAPTAAVPGLGAYLLVSLRVALVGNGPGLDSVERVYLAAAGARRQRAGRRALVAVQVALATGPVAFVAVLWGSNAFTLRAPEMGFDQSHLFVGTVGSTTRDTSWRSEAARSSLLEAIRQVPAISAAGVSQSLYLDPSAVRVDLAGATIVGQRVDTASRAPARDRGLRWDQVTPQFFSTLRLRLVAGRLPTDAELTGGDPVAVVTARTARNLAGDLAVGWRVQLKPSDSTSASVTVIGVVDDVKRGAYDELPAVVLYTPFLPGASGRAWRQSVWIRGAPLAGSVVQAVYSAVGVLDPAATLADLEPSLDATRRESRELRSIVVIVASVFGVAIGLAALGIYGIIAYAAVMRRKEVAIRLALGASRAHVALLVVREAARQAGLGLAVGVVGGTLAAAWMPDRSTALGAPPRGVMLFSALVLAATLIVAAIGPVRRVWRVDSAGALREEG
jgi:hypothetical protein